MIFVIEDQIHADWHGEFSSFQAAVCELKRRAQLPWDEDSNRAPCMSWKTCGRSYAVIEFDDSQQPRREVRRIPVLEVSATGVKWADGLQAPNQITGANHGQR